VRPVETKNEALRLAGLGLNDCEIARRLEVPRTTVRDWRKPRYVPRDRPACPLCAEPSRPVVVEPESYAELLGLYLGDGHITDMPRTQRLRLFLDTRYPQIVDDAERLIQTLLPVNRVRRMLAEQGRMAVVWSYSSHLSCLFPQHGDGKKHERAIVLEPWQRELVAAAPWALRVPQLRVRKPLCGHPRSLRADVPERRPAAASVRPCDPPLPARGRRAARPPRRRQGVNGTR